MNDFIIAGTWSVIMYFVGYSVGKYRGWQIGILDADNFRKEMDKHD